RRAALGVIRILLQGRIRLAPVGSWEKVGEAILWPHWHRVISNYAGDDPELVAARKAITERRAEADKEVVRVPDIRPNAAGGWTLTPPKEPTPGWSQS